MRSLLVLIFGVLLLAQPVRAQNLLQNGSFEDPDVGPATALLANDIPGWTSEVEPCPVEVQDNCCGAPFDGDQHLELDSQSCNSTISQTVATQSGAKYLLSFVFAARPFVTDNHVIVRWNGSPVFDLTAGSLSAETEWATHAAVVTAAGTTSTVEISGGDIPDGSGTYVDDVPEPGRSAQLAAGLSLLAILDVLRGRMSRSRPWGRSS